MTDRQRTQCALLAVSLLSGYDLTPIERAEEIDRLARAIEAVAADELDALEPRRLDVPL
jgi:hypothetical protein